MTASTLRPLGEPGTVCSFMSVLHGKVLHRRFGAPKGFGLHWLDAARPLRSSLLVVHAESADRALRERHALRIPQPRSGYPATRGRVAAALAAAHVPATGGRR